jgi:hypothetical protein
LRAALAGEKTGTVNDAVGDQSNAGSSAVMRLSSMVPATTVVSIAIVRRGQ